MGAIYRRYHEKHKQLRAERAAAVQREINKFAEAARTDRLRDTTPDAAVSPPKVEPVETAATDPAPGPTRNSESMRPPAPAPAADATKGSSARKKR